MQPDGVPDHGSELLSENQDEIEMSVSCEPENSQRSNSNRNQYFKDLHLETRQKNRLHIAMVVTAVAVAVHNFPEGVASYIATMRDPKVGLPVAFAIAVHNIPEGLCVAMPIFFATGNRTKAILVAAGTGALEFIGALVAYALPTSLFTEFFFGGIFAGTAGMMIFVSFVELLPVARLHDPENKVTTKDIFAGMLVMAISLILLAAAGLS